MDLSIEASDTHPRPNNILLTPLTRRTSLENCRRLDRLVQDDHESEVVKCLQVVDSRIHSIRTMTSPEPMIYADVGLRRMVPAGLLGDGVHRLLSLSLAMFEARDGLI